MNLVGKNIKYPYSISNRLTDVVLKLKIKFSKNVSQEQVINRYIEEGLKRDESKLKSIIIK